LAKKPDNFFHWGYEESCVGVSPAQRRKLKRIYWVRKKENNNETVKDIFGRKTQFSTIPFFSYEIYWRKGNLRWRWIHHSTFSGESYMCNLSESNIATFLILGGHNSQGLLFILNEIHKYERNRKPSQSISSKTQKPRILTVKKYQYDEKKFLLGGPGRPCYSMWETLIQLFYWCFVTRGFRCFYSRRISATPW